ncbi:hypothetical protein I3760_12G005600 [Carya illinoinensis]|nr:hypothetical protein I3760_12G005600 [Carya illinoinensis]
MVFSLPSSSSSSSSTSRWSHHVFLSFRGKDTRNTFTAHLYDALCRRGINTYIDEKDLEKGESISPKLLKIIEESMISIIVLSPNYASSTWCLEELTKILECKETKKQIVLPVFYHVDPSEIRYQRGRFGEALTKHQERFKDNTKVQRWKATLQEVANLAGEHLDNGFHGNKLTIFGMPYSLIKELGDLKPKNLTDMDLSHCKFLTKIPDLSSSPNLKQLNLQCCENLVEVHHSVGFLDKLSVFLVNGCCKLRIFQKRFKLRSLYVLELYDCSSLEDFPEIECEMVFLYGICLEGTGIKELPVSIENLTELKQLDLDDTGIKELPSSIGSLTKLEVLSLNDTCIKELPSSIGNLSELEKLYLNDTVIKELPSSIGNLTKLEALYLNGSSIEELPSSIGNLTQLRYLYARGCKNLVHLPSSIDQLQSLRFFQLDSGSQPINIGNVEEDGMQSPPFVVSTGEYEIASSAELTPTNSSIFNDGSSSSTNGALLVLSLQFCCLSESNFFTNANYFPTLVELDLTGSDIVIFPQSDRFAVLRHLCLNNCKELEEILPLPLSIEKVEARGCTSLESFAQLSEILFKNNGRDFSFLKIDLYGCHKLLVNMTITSWEERHSKEQNWAYPFKARSMGIIFLGKRIPSWFKYCKEAHDSNSCEIDINRMHYGDDVDEIVFCVVIGFRTGINLEMEKTAVCVRIHDGWHWNMLFIQYIIFDWTDSDHLWMAFCPLTYRKASRFRFECDSELVVFRSVGVHLVKKHEENSRNHAGVLHEDFGAHFDAFSE